MALHPKVLEHKTRSLAINYRDLSVNAAGAMVTTFKSNLDKNVVEGYCVIWGQRNMHGEIFLKGCFAKSIREHGPGNNSHYDIKFLYCHKQDQSLSLFEEIREDDIGLYFRTVPLDITIDVCDSTIKRLKSRTLNNFSQGFDYIWEENKISYDEKTDSIVIREAILYEMSVVAIPSGIGTYTIRSKEAVDELSDETDEFIKTLPRKYQLEARHIFARHKSLILSEPLDQEENTQRNEPVTRSIEQVLLQKEFKLFN